MVKWIMTGKFKAVSREADAYVAEHRLELEPEDVLPRSFDYEQFLLLVGATREWKS